MLHLNSCQKIRKFSETNLYQEGKINETFINSGKKMKVWILGRK